MQDDELQMLGANFHFAPPGGSEAADAWQDERLTDLRQEHTDLGTVDYNVGSTSTPLSFALIPKGDLAQGYAWYKRHYPTYPQEVLMTMARAQFGERPEAKKAPEKPPAKAKPPPPTFSIVRTPMEVRFDDGENNPEIIITDDLENLD